MRHLVGVLAIILITGTVACGRGEKDQSLTGVINSSLENLERESLPGAKLVQKKCSTCHYLDRHITKVGPSLKGIVGRTPGISGVPFKKWDEKALNQWLRDPAGVKPSTLMAIPGIKSAEERSAIIEYLKQI